MNLSLRLLTAAESVRNGVRVADIGTDHAYLPAYLVISGQVVSAIATDIGEGPLKNAYDTVNRYQLQDKIQLRLSDGLDGINDDEVDDICICGMGGELIAQIIDKADWIKCADKRLILQPMSAVEDLRIYLAENGFCILNENLVKDAGRIYCVFTVEYCGGVIDYTPEYPYIGNIICDSEIAREYLTKHYNRISKHIEMLNNAKDKTNIEELVIVRNLIKGRLDNTDA